MPSNITRYTAFISSPSDLKDERAAVRAEIEKLNDDFGSNENWEVRPLMWEHDVSPETGSDPQSIISSQIGGSYDFFVGLMCARFGTPTSQFGSGTEEEFHNALTRQRNGERVSIHFFFKEPRNSAVPITAEELIKVQEFKSTISNFSIYKEFSEIADLQRAVRLTLLHFIKEREGERSESLSANELGTDTGARSPAPDQTAFADQVDEEDTPGLLDLALDAEEGMENFSLHLDEMNPSVLAFKAVLEVALDRLERAKGDKKGSRRIINGLAFQMNTYAREISVSAELARERLEVALDSLESMIALSIRDGSEDSIGFPNQLQLLLMLKEGMINLEKAVTPINAAIAGYPRLTKELNIARRNVLAAHDKISHFCESGATKIEGIELMMRGASF
ncbi:DUF4062 domain-containing protein [Rhodobacteraceae bacterium CCMM004]|nr:DUF4062 domain-containing protein [Rhodobacteraceae bacterium CCMM004]